MRSSSDNSGAQLKPQQQPVPKSASQSKTTASTGTGIAAKILQEEKRNLSFGGYNWRVLDVQGDKALMITEDIIEKRPYNTKYVHVTWVTCTLRQYLNGEFFNKFSSECRAQILSANLSNPDNPSYGTKGGNNSKDNIFLLSIDEVKKYFKNDDESVANHAGTARWWWLRSPGIAGHAAGVLPDGDVNDHGRRIDYVSGGVRPALWLNLKS